MRRTTTLLAMGLGAVVALGPLRATANNGPPAGRSDPAPAEATPAQSSAAPADAGTSDAAQTPPVEPLPVPSPRAGAAAPSPVPGPVVAPGGALVQMPGEAEPTRLPAPPPDAAPVSKDRAYVRGTRYVLSGHRENYFISGVTSAQHQVKFQFSVKFDLWPNPSHHSVYFGYTQKSLWALWDFSASSPFVETNYAPEIFYGFSSRRGDIVPQAGRFTLFLDYARAGLEHESNGLDKDTSRGWNRIQGTGRGGLYLGADHYVTLALKMWGRPFGIEDNRDIVEYLGYGTATVEYGYDPAVRRWYGGGNVTVSLSKGANTDMARHGLQVTAQWRPAYEGKFLEWWKFTPYFFAQFWEGFGETLLRYNVDGTAFRVGLSLEDRVDWVSLVKPHS